MELQDYLKVVRKRWRVIVAVVLVFVGLAAAGSLASEKVYESRTQFFVSTTGAGDNGALLQGSTFTQQRVKSYAQLLTTPRVLGPVAASVGVTGDVAGQVRATTPPDTVLIDVAVRDTDPARAQAMGEAIATEFPAAVTELESPAGAEASPVKVTVVRPPTTPDSPVSPRPLRNILLGGVLGLLLGLAAALVRETLDKTVKTQDDVKAVTDTPILGSIAY
ncbi:MAG TPA: Wzz/FepE/Etk N-terminal domain-containing protein, partial [Dermatophilaceae bacterium]|nr:Wzz/FepE/Etk N-terminal domain-containing protein [Dermatophilaceae bacterium]